MSRALSSATRPSPRDDELVDLIVTKPLGRLLEQERRELHRFDLHAVPLSNPGTSFF